jgi:hypothetical protein
VAVHPGAVAVEQHRPADPIADGAVDRPPDRRRQRDQRQLGALTCDAQDPVAVFLAQIVDVGVAGFEHPQPKQAEHPHEGEVERVR